MEKILRELAAVELAAASEDNLRAMVLVFSHLPQAELYDGSDLVWSVTDVRFPLFNSLVRARLEPEAADAAIEAAMIRCKARGVPMFWWTGPATRPAELGSLLEAHGFVRQAEMPGMAADLTTLNESVPVSPGLSIQPVSDPETLVRWCHTGNLGFGLPDFVEGALVETLANVGLGPEQPLRHYIGLLDGEPVATSSLLLAGGVAGIYNVSTLPAARRKGIGAAMTLAPLRDARALGYRIGILQSSEMGFNIYSQLGFREYFKMGLYVWPGEEAEQK